MSDTNYPRVKQKIFAGNSGSQETTIYGSAKDGNIQFSKDISQIMNSNWEGGINSAILNKKCPLLEDDNSVRLVLSQQIAYILQKGIPAWETNTTYYQYDFSRVNEKLYYSLINNNTGNNPLTDDGTNWKEYNKDVIDQVNTNTNDITELKKKPYSNTVISYTTAPTISGNTITVYAGTKILIPNGLNSDGSLKNIEYTTTTDLTFTETVSGNNDNIIISLGQGYISRWNVADFLYGYFKDRPAVGTSGAKKYFAIDTNEEWYYDFTFGVTTWTRYYEANIGTGILKSDKTYSNFQFYGTTNLVKYQDLQSLIPSSRYIDLTLGASGSTYTAPANGWFSMAKSTTTIAQYNAIHNITNHLYVNSQATAVGVVNELICPAKKGDNVIVEYTALGDTQYFRFIYSTNN